MARGQSTSAWFAQPSGRARRALLEPALRCDDARGRTPVDRPSPARRSLRPSAPGFARNDDRQSRLPAPGVFLPVNGPPRRHGSASALGSC